MCNGLVVLRAASLQCASSQSSYAAVSFLRAEPPLGQLRSLAVAHPEAYTALIDCCLRMPVLPAYSMLVPGPLLLYASPAWRASGALLENTAAVAGLASALTSLAKRTVQLITVGADLQAAAAIDEADAAATYFPAAAPTMAVDCIARPARLLSSWFERPETAASGVGNASGSSSSSGSGSQAAASAALLAVVFARSLVQLADAMEAAGPEVYLRSLLGRPIFHMRWLDEPVTADAAYVNLQIHPCGTEDQHNVEAQWQVWQLHVLQAMQHIWAASKAVGIAPSREAAEQPAAAVSTSVAAAAASETLGVDVCADS
jgi:hypothetical protein